MLTQVSVEEVKLDRRQQRTRRMLRDALISLIVERGFDSLTIQDITDRADLRRATFYLHYATKEELLMTVLRETFDELVQQMEPLRQADALGGKTQVETYAVMLRHVAENAHLYSVILGGQGGAAIARSIREYLAGHVLYALGRLPPADLKLPPEVLANYIAGTELSLISWWLEAGQPYPPDAMAPMLQQLILHGVQSSVALR